MAKINASSARDDWLVVRRSEASNEMLSKALVVMLERFESYGQNDGSQLSSNRMVRYLIHLLVFFSNSTVQLNILTTMRSES